MESKTVKVRKNHNCDSCTGLIHKGETALFDSYKTGRYDDNDKQIGIEFSRYYMCQKCMKEHERNLTDWNYNIEEIPENVDSLLVLFDNGSYCQYNEQWPFAEVIAWAYSDTSIKF